MKRSAPPAAALMKLEGGYPQCCRERAGVLSDRFLRRLRRRGQSKPEVRLGILLAGLCYRRHVRQRPDPGPRRDGERPQLARLQLLHGSRIVEEGRRYMLAQHHGNYGGNLAPACLSRLFIYCCSSI